MTDRPRCSSCGSRNDLAVATVAHDHVSTLYSVRKNKLSQLVEAGYERLQDIPNTASLTAIQQRQRKAALLQHLVVERGLKSALRALAQPLAFLDFETVALPIPVWKGCKPYDAIPVQLSCHRQRDGSYDHDAWIADGSDDPRPAAARALVQACSGAASVIAYNSGFESRAIDRLIEGVPELESELRDVQTRLVDLLPIVRDHVYDLDFAGSFSIKSVLPVLVPGEGYDDLAIADGNTASAVLEDLLFFTPVGEQRNRARRDLLKYCERDTWGMVRLFDRLRELSA